MAIVEFFLKGFSSWKTTAMGVAVLIGTLGNFLAAVSLAVTALFDGDPSTIVDWTALSSGFAAITAGFGLIFARDNTKSSEQVGAK